MLTVVAPAKVNLHLAVGAKRADGFHDVTTVMHALELHDELDIGIAAHLTVACTPDVGVPMEANLAFRAARAMGEAFEHAPDVTITVRKVIPHGAGLGGGSSDAAAVIAGLARLWGEDPCGERCTRVAASLGADVPFFLLDSGCALMIGRGDFIERTLPALTGAPVVLIRPNEPVSTAAAYAAFDAAPVAPADPSHLVAALESGDAPAVVASLANNLEAASAAVVPAVAPAVSWLRSREGVLGAAVAGSGSAVFALCGSDEMASSTAQDARLLGYWSAATRLAGSGVVVRNAL